MENFRVLDFELNNLSFTLKEHDPPKNVHSGPHELSPSEIKTYVLQSPRMKSVIRKVRLMGLGSTAAHCTM